MLPNVFDKGVRGAIMTGPLRPSTAMKLAAERCMLMKPVRKARAEVVLAANRPAGLVSDINP